VNNAPSGKTWRVGGTGAQADRRGKGDEKTNFYDYEGSKGVTAVTTTPAIYLSWFDPSGAMNQTMAVKTMNPRFQSCMSDRRETIRFA